MRIMHVIAGLETGGAECMLYRLVKNMQSHDQVVVSLTSIGSIGRVLVNEGVTVYALNMRWTHLWRPLWQLWRLIRTFKPNTIQTWMYHADLIGGIMARIAGVQNIVWNVRNTEIPQGVLSTTGIFVHLCALVSSVVPRSIICCANAGLTKHVELGYSRERVVVIPNGYDISSWQIPKASRAEVRKLYGLQTDAFVVGIVGRYDPLKGYEHFIRAAVQFANRSRRRAIFLMIGRNVVKANAELGAIMKRCGVNGHFKLMGERRDIPLLMYCMDIYCLSSTAEGFPNVVAEAMLMKTPCVVTDVGDASLIVGSTGFVVQAAQPDKLADALLACEQMSPAQLNDLGLEARQRIIDNYSISIIAHRYEEIYRSGAYY